MCIYTKEIQPALGFYNMTGTDANGTHPEAGASTGRPREAAPQQH